MREYGSRRAGWGWRSLEGIAWRMWKLRVEENKRKWGTDRKWEKGMNKKMLRAQQLYTVWKHVCACLVFVRDGLLWRVFNLLISSRAPSTDHWIALGSSRKCLNIFIYLSEQVHYAISIYPLPLISLYGLCYLLTGFLRSHWAYYTGEVKSPSLIYPYMSINWYINMAPRGPSYSKTWGSNCSKLVKTAVQMPILLGDGWS